jgi:hypothetical protein
MMDWGAVVKWAATPLLALGIYAGDQRWNEHQDIVALQLVAQVQCDELIETLIKQINSLPPGNAERSELIRKLERVRATCGRK